MDFSGMSLKDTAYVVVAAVIAIATGLVKFNKEKSTVDRSINEDRNAERKSDRAVEETFDVLGQMRIERAELTRQRDAAQERAQAAWANEITHAKEVGRLEAENALLRHEMNNVLQLMVLMRDQLRKVVDIVARFEPEAAALIQIPEIPALSRRKEDTA